MPWSAPARVLGWGCAIYALVNLALFILIAILNAYRPWP